MTGFKVDIDADHIRYVMICAYLPVMIILVMELVHQEIIILIVYLLQHLKLEDYHYHHPDPGGVPLRDDGRLS